MTAGYHSEILGNHTHMQIPNPKQTTMLFIYIYICNYEKHSHQNFCFRGLHKAHLKYDLHKPMFFPESQNRKIEKVVSILYLNYF